MKRRRRGTGNNSFLFKTSRKAWMRIKYRSKNETNIFQIEPTFRCSSKGIPSTPQQTDSHPCIRPGWSRRLSGWVLVAVRTGKSASLRSCARCEAAWGLERKRCLWLVFSKFGIRNSNRPPFPMFLVSKWPYSINSPKVLRKDDDIRSPIPRFQTKS